jgi:hypothetical protein
VSPLAVVVAGRCSAKGDALAGLRAGEVATFTVFTRDVYDNLCSLGGANITVHVDSLFCVERVDLGDGTYLVKLSCERSGEYAAKVLVNGSVIGEALKLVVKAGAVDAASCQLSGDGLVDCVAGELRTVLVSTRDAFGNAAAAGCDGPMVWLEGGSSEVPVKLERRGEAEWVAWYMPTERGEYTLFVHVNGAEVVRPVRIEVFAGPKARFVLTRLSDTRVQAGQEWSASLNAEDRFGNRCESVGDDVQPVVSVSAPGEAPERRRVLAAKLAPADGSYAIRVPCDTIGSHVLTVVVSGEEVVGSPCAVEVDAAPVAAARCYAKGIEAGLRAGEEGGFMVFTRDQYGNPCTSGGASLEVRVDQHAEGISVMPVEDLDDGTYWVKLSCKRSGEYFAEVLVNGSVIGEVLELVVKAGAVDASS